MYILNNIDSILTDTYLRYKDVPKETMFERSIAERIKLRKERCNEIQRKEQNVNNVLFKAYFTDYQSLSSMYSKLSETENTEINKIRVNLINKVLTKLKRTIETIPKDDIFKTEDNEKVIDIVERILEFNKQNQIGEGLKILIPSQILSKLPITLAQLKAGNNSETLKNEVRKLLYSLYRSKKLTKAIYNSLINTI